MSSLDAPEKDVLGHSSMTDVSIRYTIKGLGQSAMTDISIRCTREGLGHSAMTDVSIRCTQGVKNIGRWTQFCDPLKKKNGINSLEGIS